jgi:predicted DNA-binding transcriptional regulator AlpA
MPPATTQTDDTASNERALTARQVGEILGVAEITLSQWRARGEGPRFFRAGRRHVRYRLGDVIAWRDARTVGRREP